MRCPCCSTLCEDQDRFCRACGEALRADAPSPVKRRVTLGDYETALYQNEPPERAEDPAGPQQMIIDRDAPAFSVGSSGFEGTAVRLHLILGALLLAIGLFSYLGVRQVAAQRSDPAKILIRQAQLQQEADDRAEQDTYRRQFREYLIVAQAQGRAFTENAQALGRLEGRHWLTRAFLGGVYEAMRDRFKASKPFRAMAKRAQDLSDRYRDLSAPPKGLSALYAKAAALDEQGTAIFEAFSASSGGPASERILERIKAYEDALARAEEADLIR